MKKKKKAGIILGVTGIAILVVCSAVRIHVFRDKAAVSISVIGGADGPTSVFWQVNCREGTKKRLNIHQLQWRKQKSASKRPVII